MAENLEGHEVDIDKAEASMQFLLDYVKRKQEEINKAMAAAKEPLMGLLLTSIHSGLVENGSPKLSELRGKICHRTWP